MAWRSARQPTVGAFLLFALAAGGCTERDDKAANAVATSANISAASGRDPVAAVAGKQLRLILSGDGLIAASEPPGSTRNIAFGSAQSLALKAISDVLGSPDRQGDNEECPAGRVHFASWDKGLVANFQDGKFVGWGGAVDLRSARGIGFGSSRAELDKAYGAKIEETSLGVEFNADGLSGILESTAADAAITDIWAGVTCVAR